MARVAWAGHTITDDRLMDIIDHQVLAEESAIQAEVQERKQALAEQEASQALLVITIRKY